MMGCAIRAPIPSHTLPQSFLKRKKDGARGFCRRPTILVGLARIPSAGTLVVFGAGPSNWRPRSARQMWPVSPGSHPVRCPLERDCPRGERQSKAARIFPTAMELPGGHILERGPPRFFYGGRYALALLASPIENQIWGAIRWTASRVTSSSRGALPIKLNRLSLILSSRSPAE